MCWQSKRPSIKKGLRALELGFRIPFGSRAWGLGFSGLRFRTQTLGFREAACARVSVGSCCSKLRVQNLLLRFIGSSKRSLPPGGVALAPLAVTFPN